MNPLFLILSILLPTLGWTNAEPVDPKPVREVKLQYQKPLKSKFYLPNTVHDNHYFVVDDQVLIFDLEDGRLVRSLSGRGKGPGLFKNSATIFFKGIDQVILFDRARRNLLFFNWKTGEHLGDISSTAQNIFGDPVRQRLYGMNVDQPDVETVEAYMQYLIDYPKPILTRLNVALPDKIESESPPFHQLSDEVARWLMNDSRHHIAQNGDRVYVVDELKPVVFSYDAKTFKPTGNTRLPLPGFVQSPKQFADYMRMTDDEYQAWWYSFSRVRTLIHASGRTLVMFSSPTNDRNRYQLIALEMDNRFEQKRQITFNGRFKTGNIFISADSKALYFCKESDDGLLPIYHIQVFTW